MSPTHELAEKDTLGWSDILSAQLVLPTRANGVRHLLEEALTRKRGELSTLIESDSFDFIRNYIMFEDCISFQIPIGLPLDESDANYVSRKIDPNALKSGNVFVGQMNGRVLPIAASLFASAMVKALENTYNL